MDNIISQISENPRSTPVKVYLWEKTPVDFPGCRVFYGAEGCKIVMGEWSVIRPILTACAGQIADYCIEGDRRQSAVPLLDIWICRHGSSRAQFCAAACRSETEP